MTIKSCQDIENIELTPLSEQGLASSTYEALRRAAKLNSTSPAMSFISDANDISHSFKWNYSELFSDITRTANAFHALGITPDKVVAYILPNLPETHFTIWGGEAAGIVLAINPMLEAKQIGMLLNAAKASAVVTLAPTPGSDLWPKLASQLRNLTTVKNIVWVSMRPYVSAEEKLPLKIYAEREKILHSDIQIHDLRELMSAQPGTHLVSKRQIQPNERSSYFCTGGTTGLPKIAVRTHGAEIFNAWAVATHLSPRDKGQVIFCGLPLFHVNAQLVTGLMPWIQGDHVILGTPQGYRGEGVLNNFWGMVEYFGINFISGVPTVYASLLQSNPEGHNLSSLKFALCGAAPLPVELFREFEKRTNVKILEGYGLTEGTCVSSVNPPFGERRIGSIGIRIAYQNMRVIILGCDGLYLRDADFDEIGLIVISGPNLFIGYLSDDYNAGLWIEINGEKWLNTGDLGRADKQGYFWLTGRKKELIIRGGHNIDPKQIEEAIQAHPSVALVAAIGAPDSHTGEVPVAYVQLRPGALMESNELLEYAKQNISERAAVPKRIEIIKALPLTSVGKIFKPALQQIEILKVVQHEIDELGIENIRPNIIHDQQKGIVVLLSSERNEHLANRLGLYNFNVLWNK